VFVCERECLVRERLSSDPKKCLCVHVWVRSRWERERDKKRKEKVKWIRKPGCVFKTFYFKLFRISRGYLSNNLDQSTVLCRHTSGCPDQNLRVRSNPADIGELRGQVGRSWGRASPCGRRRPLRRRTRGSSKSGPNSQLEDKQLWRHLWLNYWKHLFSDINTWLLADKLIHATKRKIKKILK